jgi:RTX calcium-binding nonapeptide repeat (4 copies)
MAATTIRRSVALLASAALLAALAAATVAAPTTAAKPKCDGKVATKVSNKKVIQGTNGADVIVARGTKDNLIYGKGGRDRICAGGGNDRVYGGSGNDRIFGGSGNDKLFGQTGRDDLFGYAGRDRLDGGAQDDFLSGGTARDVIFGGPGNDVARGGVGPDSIGGDSGDDRLYGQAGNDDLDGGDGSDQCIQGPGSGVVKNCQGADLQLTVSAPSNVTDGADFTVTFTVTNLGPETSGFYSLREAGATPVSVNVECGAVDAAELQGVWAQLPAGASFQHHWVVNCVKDDASQPASDSGGLAVVQQVEVPDPVPGNNQVTFGWTIN